jgi:hypothetical protein
MGFDPWNCSTKIWESIRTPTPKVGAHLGVWRFIPSHSPTLPRAWNVTPKLHSWPAPLQALALVASSRLGLRHRPLQIVVRNQNMGIIMEFFFDKTNEWVAWWWVNVKINKENLALFKKNVNIPKEDMEDYCWVTFTHVMNFFQ